MAALRENVAPMDKVMTIGIAGGSCSGKTRLLKRLAQRLGEHNCAVVLQDDYYFSKPDAARDNLKFNFDHPDALEFELLAADLARIKAGYPIDCPQYDFALHVRKDGIFRHIAPRPVVLVDGILILDSESVRAELDHSVYIRCEAQTRLDRRVDRDVRERGRTADNVIAQFDQQVQPMHERFVAPSAEFAARVYSQDEVKTDVALDELVAYCQRNAALK
ncbi:MAG: uridine kinase [Pseudomonadota bacterium]